MTKRSKSFKKIPEPSKNFQMPLKLFRTFLRFFWLNLLELSPGSRKIQNGVDFPTLAWEGGK